MGHPGQITAFFKPGPKRGRPCGRGSHGGSRQGAGRRGRKLSAADRDQQLQAGARRLIEDKGVCEPQAKKRRRSYATGTPDGDLLRECVRGWPSVEPPTRGQSKLDREQTKREYISKYVSKGLPLQTVQQYLRETATRATFTGKRRGRAPHIPRPQQQVIADATASADRGNKGLTQGQVIGHIRTLKPGLSHEQARDTFRKTIRPAAAARGELTKKDVGTQSTTSVRTMITPRQQGRWHEAVNKGHEFVTAQNKTDGTGVQFLDVMDHFCLNFDEECFMASGKGARIVGARKAKRERETLGRVSISLCKTGNAAGDWGPIVALTAGKTVEPTISKPELKRMGAPGGSVAIATPTGFLTDDAMDNAVAGAIADGIRVMPAIRDHPAWWCFLTGDGYHAHKMTLETQKIFLERRIYFLVEEGDTSHVVQPFDRDVAKSGKAASRDIFNELLAADAVGVSASQPELVAVAIHTYKHVRDKYKGKRNVWFKSFKASNLHPFHRVGLSDWIVKIKSFLDAGSTFIDEGDVTPRSLLPEWYIQWPADRKREALAIADLISESPCGWADTDLVGTLITATEMSPSNLASYLQCYFVECADRGAPESCNEPDPSEELGGERPPEPAPLVISPNAGLLSYTLKPPGLKGEALLSHLIEVRNRASRWVQRPRSDIWKSRAYLDLAIDSNGGEDQLSAIEPTQEALAEGYILRESGATVASRKMGKRRLNVPGEVNSQCTWANNPERVRKLKQVADLSETLARIKRLKAGEAAEKAQVEPGKLKDKAPAAMEKLLGGDDPAKLTVGELNAVLVHCIHAKVGKKPKSKQGWVDLYNTEAKAAKRGPFSPQATPLATTA